MRIIASASLAFILVGTACSDRAPTGIDPVPTETGTPTAAPSGVRRALAPDALPLAPRTGDRMLVDSRRSINSATGIWRAVDGIAPGASYTGTWTFTSNVDGSGQNALRLDVQKRGSRACRIGTNAVNIPLPKPLPKHLMVQWKQRLGRTSTGGGEGRVGTYALTDVCSGINRSEMRAFRATTPSDSARLDYEWATSSLTARVQEHRPTRTAATLASAWDPRSMIGRTVTKTLYMQAESAPGAGDGILRLWVDGQLVMDQARAAISPAAFRRLNFPGRMALPVSSQTEYWWDIIAWEPTLPPDGGTGGGTGGDTTSTGGDTTSTGGDTTSTGGDTTSTGGQQDTTVATITISPSSPSILAGGTVQLQALVQNAAGDTLDTPVGWSSANTAVATVSTAGLVRGISAGSASVTATAQGRSASTIVTVGNAPVASVVVTPESDTMTVHGTRQLTVTLRDASGNTLSGRSVAWESLNSTLAAVDGNGLVTALATGTARIRAVSEGVADTATLTINPEPPAPVASVSVSLNSPSIQVGQQTTAVATMRDAGGNTLTGRAVTWSSSNAAIATVDTAGRVRAVAAGSASITATSEGKSGSATITVTNPPPAPVASVTVSPATASVQANATVQLSATTRDANNNVLTGRVVTWTSSNGAIATVSSTGLVTGVAAGSATITATSEGRSGTSAVTVTAPPPPPPTGNLVDPTLLPKATGQRPVAGTYGRSLSAGQLYVDPNTNTRVLKITDPRTPVANSGMYHGYSEGGPFISQPWTGSDGSTNYTLWLAWGDGWFVDVKYPAMTLSNWRRAPVSAEIEGAWSLDPATPRIFYYSGSNTLNRYDTQSMSLANTAGFPFNIPTSNGTYFTWIQTQLNDNWIVGMLGSNSTIVAYRPSDGTVRYITRASSGLDIDEPHIDREQPVVYVSSASSDPQNVIYNLNTNTRIDPRDTRGIVNDDHNAPLRGKIVGVSWQANAVVAVDWQGNVTQLPGGSPTNWGGDFHTAGQWIFNNPSEWWVVDQWQSAGNFPVNLGMIGIVSTAGDFRLLAAHDGVGGGYQSGGQPHPTLAPDGKLVMWTSNMNGSGRFDVFVAQVPTR